MWLDISCKSYDRNSYETSSFIFSDSHQSGHQKWILYINHNKMCSPAWFLMKWLLKFCHLAICCWKVYASAYEGVEVDGHFYDNLSWSSSDICKLDKIRILLTIRATMFMYWINTYNVTLWKKNPKKQALVFCLLQNCWFYFCYQYLVVVKNEIQYIWLKTNYILPYYYYNKSHFHGWILSLLIVYLV